MDKHYLRRLQWIYCFKKMTNSKGETVWLPLNRLYGIYGLPNVWHHDFFVDAPVALPDNDKTRAFMEKWKNPDSTHPNEHTYFFRDGWSDAKRNKVRDAFLDFLGRGPL